MLVFLRVKNPSLAGIDVRLRQISIPEFHRHYKQLMAT